MELRKIILVTIACALSTLGVLLAVRASYGGTTLLVHAGAGIRPPLDELGKIFEEKTGVKVEYSYKGSGCLLADICFSRRGDVYIPGETYYMEQALDRKLITKYRAVASMSTVLIVQAGNPKGIRALGDLARQGLRVGLADPEAVAAGRAANEGLVKAGVLDQVQRNVVMSALNVVELGNAVKLGHLDAAIVWDATAALYSEKEVSTIELPKEWRVEVPIPVGVLKFSKHPKAAARFMDFLASHEAEKVFAKHEYGSLTKQGKCCKEGKV